ncbi:MAG: DUF2083 domain-containing protein [Proteobacteria bacterium]|nr:DUF2083 domain-containing protein [Pseudomonadota bacterium]
MPHSLISTRIRERRRALGMTQSKLAATLGISASYLNLIELNKRSIGGALLKRVASVLGMSLDELDGAAGRRLLDDLHALAADPRLAGLGLDATGVHDLAGRHPAWARALLVLQRSLVDRDGAVAALSDRLGQDPHLNEIIHDVRSRIAAIRSSSEILESVDDLEPRQRQRFVAIIGDESARLSDLAQALGEFFEPARTPMRSLTPAEEVDDFLFDHDNHFPALEDAADALRGTLPLDGDLDAGAVTQPRATQRFLAARAAVLRFGDGRVLQAEVDAAPRLTSDAARKLAHRALSSYLAAALLMPYAAFLAAAERTRYDIEALCQQFGVSYEQTCHRLVTLRRPGAEGIPFGFMRTDPAGFVTKRFPLPNLLLPRRGNACPLWAAYTAFQAPGAIQRQLAAFPTGDRYLFVACAIEKPRPAFPMPRRLVSVMLACHALHADRTVYGDALDLSSSAPWVPVGPNCQLCVRGDCAYREEAAIIDR